MADIRHRIGTSASPEQAYQAVATREGWAGWWTRQVEGESQVGGRLRFFFGSPEPAATMEVTELTPNQRVRYRCVQGPDEWLNTELLFEIKREGDTTVLLFSHNGWREPVEFMHHCSTRWAYFLFSLKAGLDGGRATPFPEDEPIDNWGASARQGHAAA